MLCMLLFLGAPLADPEVILKLESKVVTACKKCIQIRSILLPIRPLILLSIPFDPSSYLYVYVSNV